MAGVLQAANAQLTNTGPISIDGAVRLPPTGIFAVSTGAPLNGGGVITAGTLTGQAFTASLGGANSIATLGAFAAGPALILNDVVPLTVAGPVSAGTATLASSGTIGFTGPLAVTALDVVAGGSVIQSAGTITAQTLAGSAVGSAIFGPDAPGPVANIGTLAAFSVTGANGGTGTLSVASAQALEVDGPVSAAALALSAPGTLSFAGGTISTSLGTFSVGAGSNGLLLLQTGTTTFGSVAGGSATPSLLFELPGDGQMQFANLVAPTSSVALDTGSGIAAGTVNVGALLVLGSGGSATLTGTVTGQAGPNAAVLAGILPAVNTNYTLNGCVIAAANCGMIIQPVQPSQPNPPAPDLGSETQVIESVILPPNALLAPILDAADSVAGQAGARSAFRIPFLTGLLSFVFSRDVDDPDLVLPNISDRDY